MSAVNLSNFPTITDHPRISRNSTDLPSHKAIAPQPVTRVIESACTTQRAAYLIGISTATLYRALKEGKAYRKGQWTAIAIGDNTWRVTHTCH